MKSYQRPNAFCETSFFISHFKRKTTLEVESEITAFYTLFKYIPVTPIPQQQLFIKANHSELLFLNVFS